MHKETAEDTLSILLSSPRETIADAQGTTVYPSEIVDTLFSESSLIHSTGMPGRFSKFPEVMVAIGFVWSLVIVTSMVFS